MIEYMRLGNRDIQVITDDHDAEMAIFDEATQRGFPTTHQNIDGCHRENGQFSFVIAANEVDQLAEVLDMEHDNDTLIEFIESE